MLHYPRLPFRDLSSNHFATIEAIGIANQNMPFLNDMELSICHLTIVDQTSLAGIHSLTQLFAQHMRQHCPAFFILSIKL